MAAPTCRTRAEYGADTVKTHETPLLYNLDVDPSEQFDLAADRPEIVAELKAVADEHVKTVVRGADQLSAGRAGRGGAGRQGGTGGQGAAGGQGGARQGGGGQ